MEHGADYRPIIESLYVVYTEKGFLREEDALEMMSASGVSLVGINRITNRLLELGVIFASDDSSTTDDDDYSQTDYEPIFAEVLSISPGQSALINYVRDLRPPQWREWVNLMPQAKSSNQYASNRLFDMYLRVVIKIALSSYKNNGYELDDLIQEGSIGLMTAIRRYDSSKHGSFVSYMPWWVMQYMGRAIADKSRTIRVPVHTHESIKAIAKIYDSLSDKYGREPTDIEISNEAGITVERIKELRVIALEPESLDTPLDEEKDIYFSDVLLAPEDEQPFSQFAYKNMRSVLLSVLDELTEREKRVLSLRYGIDDDQARTLEEVGQIFNVTRERIRQIEAKALRRLQQPSKVKKIIDFY